MFNNSANVNASINKNAIDNLSKVKSSLFILPLFILLAIVLLLYYKNGLNSGSYVQIQKNYFLLINSKLSRFPSTIYNFTQLGDALIFLSLLTISIVRIPKVWESLLSASLVSTLLSNLLKKAFSIPRPAAMFDNQNFVIIGKTLTGHNSLPSGHSITVFTILTVLLFAFMPNKSSQKVLAVLFTTIIGLFLVFTRVGVGAHYPLDTIVGSIVGYISGIIGILISQKYKIWSWIGNKKYYPILIVLLLICFFLVMVKINSENLVIFYFSLTSLVVALYKTVSTYVQK